jgi:phosphoribosylformimino-5-aminoimidazole carboxamide ribonucleotide (ProFAR) isomerase
MEIITVRINKPDINYANAAERQAAIEQLARDLAEQIVIQIDKEEQQATIDYWNNKMMRWKLKDSKALNKVYRSYDGS